jgi:thiamine kinase-like enzyme
MRIAVPSRATVSSNIDGRATGSNTASTAALRSIRQPYPSPLELERSGRIIRWVSPSAVDAVLPKLSVRLGSPDGDPELLETGISRRSFRVRLGGRDYVVHLGGKDIRALGISRSAEQDATAAAARAGLGPDVAAYLPDEDVLVTRYIEGRPLRPDEVSEPDILADLAESLKTLHRGARLRSTFSPFRIVEQYRAIADEHGGGAGERYERAHALAQRIEPLLSGPDHAPVPSHNDLVPSNLIYDGERVRIVDWEYAGMGDRFFDLGNLSANAGFDEGDDEWLLTAYYNEPPTARRFAALRLMRLMSDFREAMWGVVQDAISTLDFDFAAYADKHFTRLEEAADEALVERWLAEIGV